MNGTVDKKYYEAARPASLAERLMVRARTNIYADFMQVCAPDRDASILDVGVSDVVNDGANMLEQLYPHPHRITAAGLGQGEDFRNAYPRVAYTTVASDRPLPFPDQSFEIATANAVLEHVGGIKHQQRFLMELVRVARDVFVSVPNRYFPVEHHTAIPLLHFSNPSFRLACRILGKDKWAQESELILMSVASLKALAPADMSAKVAYTGLRLGPFSSNLYLYLNRTPG